MLRELCIMKISSASHYCSAENSSEEPKKMIRRTENKWKGWNDIIKTSKQLKVKYLKTLPETIP